ncbi:MAG: hypothetical protein GY835_12120 [bacterium]|nr:hypothetical protein [bacterium]
MKNPSECRGVKRGIEVGFRLDPEAKDAILALLLDPAAEIDKDDMQIVTRKLNGKKIVRHI